MKYLVYVLLNLYQQTQNGLPFGLPSNHTLQNMIIHHMLRVTELLETVKLVSTSILLQYVMHYHNQPIARDMHTHDIVNTHDMFHTLLYI